jgi:hypothetical protein
MLPDVPKVCGRSRLVFLAGWFLLPAGFLAGCIPFPHRDHRAPDVKGVLTRDGQPLAGITVEYEAASVNEKWSAVTDAKGKFSFEGPKKRAWFLVFGDRVDYWNISFHISATQVYTLEDHGYWGGPSLLEVRCDLRPEPAPPWKIEIPQASTHRSPIDRPDIRCDFSD